MKIKKVLKLPNSIYLIRFIYPNEYNWTNISNIDKETFEAFVDYLYTLKRNINVLPYIPGGGSPIPQKDLDRTYLVHLIVADIKKKLPKNQLLDKHFVHRYNYGNNYNNPFNLFFKEDICEFLKQNTKLSKNDIYDLVKSLQDLRKINKNIFSDSEHFDVFNSWLNEDSNKKPWIGTSRWMFIYMFRNEFKKFMHDRNYQVIVEGGWVLNDKNREIKLGLIDENGELY